MPAPASVTSSTAVYAQQHGEWVEILGGLDPGARYVTENSYVIKADIEKSGASHDH